MRMTRSSRLGVRRWLLVGLELFLVVGASVGTWMFLGDPTGEALGMAETLADLPFDSFVVPAIALLVTNGVVPLVAAVAAIQRRRFAPVAHLVVGVTTLGWMGAQMWFIGGGMATQGVIIVVGLAITALSAPAFGLREWSGRR